MPVDTERVETITFDSFTTIVDVLTSTERKLNEYIEDSETVSEVASLWRFRAVEYRMLSNSLETYETYYETTRDALEYALESFDVELAEGEIEDIVSEFFELDVYDDVYESFRNLHEQGYELYIVSNGTPDLLDSMISNADIGEFIADTVSADDVKTYKPDIKFYRHAAEQTNTSAENIVHVAAPWYDIYGANNAGMQTIWLNRTNKPWEKYEGEPDEILTSLTELLPIFR